MKKTICVSIIVPVSSTQAEVQRCMSSLFGQTLEEIEIILIDHKTMKQNTILYEEYCQYDSRVQVLYSEKDGLHELLNKGLQAATGETILFIHSKDWIEKEMAEEMYYNTELNRVDLAVCEVTTDDSNLQTKTSRPSNWNSTFVGRKNIVNAILKFDKEKQLHHIWNKMYRRTLIEDNQLLLLNEEITGYYLFFNIAYLRKVTGITFTPNKYYHYHEQNELDSEPHYCERLYQQMQYYNIARKQLYYYYHMNTEEQLHIYASTYMRYVFNCLALLYNQDQAIPKKEKLNFFRRVLDNKEIKRQAEAIAISSFEARFLLGLYRWNNTEIMYWLYFLYFKLKPHLYSQKIKEKNNDLW